MSRPPVYRDLFAWLTAQRRQGVSAPLLVGQLQQLGILAAWLRTVDDADDFFYLQRFLPW